MGHDRQERLFSAQDALLSRGLAHLLQVSSQNTGLYTVTTILFFIFPHGKPLGLAFQYSDVVFPVSSLLELSQGNGATATANSLCSALCYPWN